MSFVKNPLYTASNYTKMSLKNTQAVKDLEIVNTLLGSKDDIKVHDIKENWSSKLNQLILYIIYNGWREV